MRILVIFHVYYEHLAAYYLDKMRNIHSCDWKLMVTGHNLSAGIKERIRDFKEDTEFLECDNIGYDVWPFIAGIKAVNLDDYDIVIKLHTKNEDGSRMRLNGEMMSGVEWRNYMVDALMKDKEAFGKLLSLFRENGKLGIAYSQMLNFKSRGGHPEDGSLLENELSRLGIERSSSMFCAGTMFAARACTLKFLQREEISSEVFQKSGPSHGSATMAHVYERLIPISIVSGGYGLKLIHASRWSAFKFAVKDCINPAIQWLFSIDRYGDGDKYLKICGILIKL